MSQIVNQYISENNIEEAISQCMRENKNNLGFLLAKIIYKTGLSPEFYSMYNQLQQNIEGEKLNNVEIIGATNEINDNPPLIESEEEEVINSLTRVMLYCNWTNSKELCELWNKMSQGDYTWNNFKVVWEEPADYYVVINSPPVNVFPDPSKTIIFRMEPDMENHPEIWGDWANPKETEYKFVGFHNKHYNNNEWHLSKTYSQLCYEPIIKNDEVSNILSTVLSDKYKDPGHVKRIDFVKFLETKEFPIHVYGGNKFEWKDYKGSLPPHRKDDAMFPYKYTFNVENHEINGYHTEKLIDGILAESLVFYNGDPSIRQYFDERAFVWLELLNFESDYEKIKKSIENNLWEERLPYIKEAKNKILNETQFFPRLEKIIS